MRIAQIAPIIESVPPRKYGGTERVVHTLTEELVKLGHEVTMFATSDSVTSGKLVSVALKPLREIFKNDKTAEIYGMNYLTILHIAMAYSQQDRFDVIHDHTGHYGLLAANMATTPVVMTLHGPLNDDNKLLFQSMRHPFFVPISNFQVFPTPRLNRLPTVYNGLNLKNYPMPNGKNGGYLLFVGRFSQEKGAHLAIEVAKKLGLPLIMAAKLDRGQKTDVIYFKKYVKPQLSDQIKWVGEVNEEERNQLMANALAFLHPVSFAEPFGLTLIEAMACGLPVIAFGQGSIPEVIEDGKTGFVVRTVDEMISAVKKIDKISRDYCAKYSRVKFSAERMAKGYIDAYQEAVQKTLQKRKTVPIFTNPIRPHQLRLNLKEAVD